MSLGNQTELCTQIEKPPNLTFDLFVQENDPSSTSRDHADGPSATKAEEPGSEAAVRKVLADILMDNAQLRRALNSSLRALFTSPKAPAAPEENGVEAVKKSGMLSRFLQ